MIRPSQTRRGQRIDNPPLEYTDTARLRVLLEEETQDSWHEQEEFNRNVEKILAVHQERWKSHYAERTEYARKSEIAWLKWAIGALATGAAVALKVLFDMANHG